MHRDVLLDTGPLVAALDPNDQWHSRCVDAWPELIARCVTCEAVITEASHLVMRGRGRASAPLEFVLEAGIPVVPLDRNAQRRVLLLMERYRDVPMDYADAALVAISEALRITTVFTLDRRGFRTYAPRRGASFVVHPAA